MARAETARSSRSSAWWAPGERGGLVEGAIARLPRPRLAFQGAPGRDRRERESRRGRLHGGVRPVHVRELPADRVGFPVSPGLQVGVDEVVERMREVAVERARRLGEALAAAAERRLYSIDWSHMPRRV